MSAHLFIECPCGYFVPVDFESTGGLTAGLRPARITYPHLQSRGLQIPEDIVVITGTITTLVPVDLQSTGWLIAGLRPAAESCSFLLCTSKEETEPKKKSHANECRIKLA